MEKVRLAAVSAGRYRLEAEKTASITGMVQSVRRMAWGGFLLLRTEHDLVQVVFEADNSRLPVDRIRPEATVRVDGTVKSARITDRAVRPSGVEIHADAIELISEPEVGEFPVDITKKELTAGLGTIFDYRPLTLRHPKQRALFRIQSEVQQAFGEYLSGAGFTRIASPKLVRSGAEGGANIFSLDYFETEAYLAQSPQFYKQMMVGVFGRVYEVGPVFRAEKHNTSRHLNEYVSLDLEMRLENSYAEIMQVEANLINAIIERIASSCEHEIGLLGVELPRPIESLAIVPFAEAIEIVWREFGLDQRSEPDLSPEAEAHICTYAEREWESQFVFVTEFPSAKRPFYAMDDPVDPSRTLSFDLLFRGVEITTGGQRLHRYSDYVAKMNRLGMDPSRFESYLQTFKFGMPPHGGLGFGLERFTARLCGVDNVKCLSLFPRDRNRLEP